jgi:hypothetical protein
MATGYYDSRVGKMLEILKIMGPKWGGGQITYRGPKLHLSLHNNITGTKHT